MVENLIIYGVYASLVGFLASSGIALLKNSLKSTSVTMFLSSLSGLVAGAAYLLYFPGRELIVGQCSLFFNFSLTLSYLSAIFMALVSGISGLVIIYSSEYLDRYKKIYNVSLVQSLTSLFIFGMLGVLLSGEAIGFMVFWEVMSVSSFFLVMADKTQKSARAAFIYFIMTHLGAAAILSGFLILSHGSLYLRISDIADITKGIDHTLLIASFVLFFFGFGSKAGLVPFHIWLPEAHPQAPTNISALMSGLMLKIAVYGFLRIAFVFYGVPAWLSVAVIALGIISAFYGALYAAIARDIKKAFAFSSIENVGIIFTMIGFASYIMTLKSIPSAAVISATLVAYAIYHSINHAVFKTGLFLSSGVIISKTHSRSLEAMGGIAKMMPIFSFVFLVIILASAALPPLGTFYGEWGFVRTMVEFMQSGNLDMTSLVLLFAVLPTFAMVTGLAVFAMVKIFGISMLGLPRTHLDDKRGGDKMLIAPLIVLGSTTMFFGFFAKDILEALARNMNSVLYVKSSSLLNTPISSLRLFIVFIGFFVLAFIVYRLFLRNGGVSREYQTWDCGQPIDSSMEYTATAFSAPIRFFFLRFIQREKRLISVPVIATNPWIANRTFVLKFSSAWQEKFYKPVAGVVFSGAEKIRLMHTGRIQYYLFLLLITLVITLIIAL